MASPSGGTSSGSSQLRTSGSEEDLQAIMEQRKRKRMLSNRESARRSRARKQKAMDDLTCQLNQLGRQKSSILTALSIANANYSVVEAENSVLRTQMWELSSRLQSLREILLLVNGSNGSQITTDDSSSNPWNLGCMNQPIMASADVYQYYYY